MIQSCQGILTANRPSTCSGQAIGTCMMLNKGGTSLHHRNTHNAHLQQLCHGGLGGGNGDSFGGGLVMHAYCAPGGSG